MNFIDGSLVEWDGGLMMMVGWLDDGGCVGCFRSVREMTVEKNKYFIE